MAQLALASCGYRVRRMNVGKAYSEYLPFSESSVGSQVKVGSAGRAGGVCADVLTPPAPGREARTDQTQAAQGFDSRSRTIRDKGVRLKPENCIVGSSLDNPKGKKNKDVPSRPFTPCSIFGQPGADSEQQSVPSPALHRTRHRKMGILDGRRAGMAAPMPLL
jgi:hypothetical protein